MTEFREVRREALLPDQIAADILAKITEGHFRPGDVLPTEHCLADVFGVSRNVVREAIARLRSDGAIEIPPGTRGHRQTADGTGNVPDRNAGAEQARQSRRPL
ncbi:GntR family transcriptional regulator [Roseibium salinum]|nr:GntR family transcriptional regulator [Roseibium salinum]